MKIILSSLISAVIVEILWVGALFTAVSCTHSKYETRYAMKVKPGCELTQLDFGTGQGMECYCKVEAVRDDKMKAYVYIPVSAQDCK